MTFRFHYFLPDDEDELCRARPGSPPAFFSLPSPVSPRVCGNCIPGLAAEAAAAAAQRSSTPVRPSRGRLPEQQVRAEAVVEVKDKKCGSACDTLKGLVPCSSVSERNLLADTARVVKKNKNIKRKDDLRKIVTENLSSLGYDSSICKSKWDKTSSLPAGEYEFIDVIVQGERLLIGIDFRSEFEIARSTGTYRAILQSLPYIFVGRADRLSQIVRIVSEAAKQNCLKKGMHLPPWRKAEYIQAKWLSPCTRTAVAGPLPEVSAEVEGGDFELIFG